ncbi:hypothetical protein ACQR1Y_12280 [Bradyrhizobium sp. HKCCYLRH3099]|uniref:hypothetical protein n=1 Tax=unclassified Bradyrhizobium TaxID=2631580 RepID=UPI003EB7032D
MRWVRWAAVITGAGLVTGILLLKRFEPLSCAEMTARHGRETAIILGNCPRDQSLLPARPDSPSVS